MRKSKNDIAWETLFEKHKLLEKISATSHAKISASEINKEREARLMTKFDHDLRAGDHDLRAGDHDLRAGDYDLRAGDYDLRAGDFN
jgi:hypothetical protein